MNLTEPQAGSDLAAVRTRAVPQGDGTYSIFGQKIFITYGEHDYTENIIHLVLARTPDAPAGRQGHIAVRRAQVPRQRRRQARRAQRRALRVDRAQARHPREPDRVMAYGDHGGAIGYLVGEENRGLEYMFIMMNLARFSVGMEGVGIAERAYQRAVAYARDRVQGKAVGADKGARAGPIIEHPDIRRMLMTMRAHDRGDARGRLRHRRGDGQRAPPSRCRGAQAAPGVRRPDDPDRQGLVAPRSRRRSRRSACRCTAAWATSRRPAPRSTSATRASPRSTKARPASRPTTSSAARRRATAARSRAAWPARSTRSPRSSPRHDDADLQVDRRAALADAVAALQARHRLGGAGVRRAAARGARRRRCRTCACGARWPGAGSSGARRSSPRGSCAAGTGDAGFLQAKIATARYYADCLLPQALGAGGNRRSRPATRRWRCRSSSSERPADCSRGPGAAQDAQRRAASRGCGRVVSSGRAVMAVDSCAGLARGRRATRGGPAALAA